MRARTVPARAARAAEFGSGSATSARSARTRRRRVVAERERAGRSPASATSRSARRSTARRLEALVVVGRLRRVRQAAARSCSGSSASRRAPASVPGSRGEERQLALPLEPTAETPELPEQTVWERMLADYRTTDLSVGVHPLELLRPHLPGDVVLEPRPAGASRTARSVAVAGLAIARQRPATANGVVFMLLEDEHGQVNLIVPPPVYERYRAIVRGEPLLLARGTLRASRPRTGTCSCAELESLGPLARRVVERGRASSARCRRRTTSAIVNRQ